MFYSSALVVFIWYFTSIFQGLYLMSGKTSYRPNSWSLQAARLNVILPASLWNFTGIYLRTFQIWERLEKYRSEPRGIDTSYGKTPARLMNRAPELLRWHQRNPMRRSYVWIKYPSNKTQQYNKVRIISLQWRHNERDGDSNHQPHDCLLNCLLRRRSKKTANLRVTGLCEGNSPVTGEFPAQRASNTENVFIWWRHHDAEVLECTDHKHCWELLLVNVSIEYWYLVSHWFS